MTDTTKPTGDTIDDAIMELANIMCGEPEICEEHWGAAESAIKAGYRRLAPRADALIEREQVRKAVIAGAIEARGRSEDEQFSVITDAIMKISAITDSVMALLPRAPMPDVVTISRASARHGLDAMELLEREQPADEPQQFPTWYEAMREITAALEAKT